MVNKAVGRREENALVTVLPVDHVRRAALVAMDLDDLAVTIHIALMPPLDGQPISDRCFHNSPSPRRYVPGLSVASPAVEIRVPGRSGTSGDRDDQAGPQAVPGPRMLAGSLMIGKA